MQTAEGKSQVELEHSIGYNGAYLNTIQWHPTEKDTLLYNNGGLLCVESLHDKHKQEFLRGHDMEISCLAVSNNGKIVASGQAGTQFQRTPEAPVILWNWDTRKPIAVLKGMLECVNLLAFSPDDRYLAGVGKNNTFIIWDTRDGSPIHTRITEQVFTILTWGDIITDQNPKHPSYTLIQGNTTQVFINKLEFDISSMQYFLKQGTCQLPNTGLTRQYTFSRCQGDLLVAGTLSGEICVFSIYNSIYRASMPISSNGVLCGAIGGDHIYVGAGDGKVKKVTMTGATGGWALTCEVQLDSKVVSINLSPDGQELLAGTLSGKMYRILTNDFSFLLHSDSHSACINDVAFGSESNQFVAIDEHGMLKLWDLGDYKPVLTLSAPKAVAGVCCTIAKDDGTVITGWRDGFLRCFDVKQRRAQIWEVANAHRGAITSVYADANYILTGGEDGAVRVWSRSVRQLLVQFNGKRVR